MGAKRLKAIVLPDGDFRPAVVDPEALGLLRRRYAAAASANPLARWQHDPPGFGTWPAEARPGTFAIENYRTSRTNDLDALAGLVPAALARHLAWGEAGCPSCPTDCIKGFGPVGGRDVTAARREGGLHQEAVAALGPNLGLGDAARVLALNDRALRLGLDPVSLGFTISFALEARARGLVGGGDLAVPGRPATEARFGNAQAIARLVEQVGHREGPAAWLADGARRAADAVGGPAVELAMHVKGSELPVFDPRTSPGIALGYAVSPTGPRYDFLEHDADFDDVAPAWPHALDLARPLSLGAPFPMTALTAPKVRAIGVLARLWSAFDALEVCLFATAPTRPLSIDDVATTVRAITGWDTRPEEVLDWGRRRLDLLRRYALREGLGVADDVLPDRFFDEPIDAGPFRGAVLERDLFATARTALYVELGWDRDGIPPGSAVASS
jgi:aldehyde:ferredoxin oxidoreductase